MTRLSITYWISFRVVSIVSPLVVFEQKVTFTSTYRLRVFEIFYSLGRTVIERTHRFRSQRRHTLSLPLAKKNGVRVQGEHPFFSTAQTGIKSEDLALARKISLSSKLAKSFCMNKPLLKSTFSVRENAFKCSRTLLVVVRQYWLFTLLYSHATGFIELTLNSASS